MTAASMREHESGEVVTWSVVGDDANYDGARDILDDVCPERAAFRDSVDECCRP